MDSKKKEIQALKCSFPQCYFLGKSKHALRTHMLISHHNKKDTVLFKNFKKSRKSIPYSSSDGSKRLLIDQVNSALFARDETEEVYMKPDGLCLEFDVPKPPDNEKYIQTVSEQEKDIEELTKLFVKLGLTNSEKTCNELLSSLRKRKGSLKAFLERFQTMSKIKEHRLEREKDQLERKGFRKETIRTEDGVACEIYLRNPIEVIKEQISFCASNDIILQPAETIDIRTHPMNSNLGVKAVKKVIAAIKLSTDDSVFWRNRNEHDTESFVALVQLYSDKTQTSLNQSSFSFYPIHLNLLNFKESFRRENISSGRSIAAFLPVEYHFSNDEDVTHKKGVTGFKLTKRVHQLKALHQSVNYCMEALKPKAIVGIPMTTSDGSSLHTHVLVSSYIADLPEAEDMTGIKRGGSTSFPCHRCMVPKESMNKKNTNFPKRNIKTAMQLMNEIRDGVPNVVDKFNNLSMHPLVPVLSDFPFSGIDPCVDTYAIFTVGPMHTCWLGISKTLKECATVRLEDRTLSSNAIKSSSGAPRMFFSIRRTILRILNSFLSNVEHISVGYDLHVDFSKHSCSGTISGLFTDSGIAGMLEASDLKSVDMVSPFLGAIIDRCCGEVEGAPITKVFTQFKDLMDEVYQRNKVPGWSETCLRKLSTMISNFKTVGCNVFREYQPSSMGFPKWHLLDHIVSDISSLGSVVYMEEDLYEMAHKTAKLDHKYTSKRSNSVMNESMKRQEQRIIERESNRSNISPGISSKRSNPSQLESVRTDSAFLVRTGPICCFLDIENQYRNMYNKRKNIGLRKVTPSFLVELSEIVGEGGLQTLIVLLKERFNSLGISHISSFQNKLQFPASAFVSGYCVPRASNISKQSNEVHIEKSNLRFSQRLVAARHFYASERPRLDNVMIEGVPCEDSDKMNIWFAKVLSFVRICKEHGDSRRCVQHERKNCPVCDKNVTQELAFVQYYEVLGEKELKMDRIDLILDCIRLQWQKTKGEYGKTSSAKYYDLVPVDTIRGKVHIVPADHEIFILDSAVERKKEYDILRADETGWPASIFYVNRFYRTKGEVYEFDETEVE